MLFVMCVCLAAFVPSTATASHPLDDFVPAGANAAELREIETAVLGPEHAAEHAVAARTAEEAGSSDEPADPRAAISSEGAALLRAPGTPAEIGEWTEAPFAIPTYAINSVQLPTGKVLFWGRPPRPVGGGTPPNLGQASLWSPWLGTGPAAFTDVVPPTIDPDGSGPQSPGPAPFFCSGQSFLPSGEVVVAGGTLVYPNTYNDDEDSAFRGLATIFIFDPFSETWVRQPDMDEGRWYPTQVMLPDGRTVVAGGLSDVSPGGVQTNNVEVFNPPATIGGQGSVEQKPTSFRNGLGLYPRLFTFNDDVLLLGPRKSQTATLDTTSFTWNESLPLMSRNRLANNAVRRPGAPAGSNAFTEIGGYDKAGLPGPYYPATNTTETIDVAQASPAFAAGAPLNVPRANSNTVLLPDGSMVTVGGGSGFDEDNGGGFVTYADGRARQVELYDPATNSWRLGPSQQEDRAYHSTAVLLPDGRVFSAGDDKHPEQPNGENSRSDTAEIYSPPYLFKGTRPVIDSAPEALNWGDSFGIASASPGVERAVLVAPSAVTHGVDMNQRHVELKVLNEIPGEGIDVVSPPSDNVAPPGYYMLFLLDAAGVPSVASWVKIDPTAPDQPLIGPAPVPPVGDINGDGYVDRVVGAPLEDIGSVQDAGAINVIYGSASGLAGAGNQFLSQNDVRGSAIASETDDRFGAALTTGDFNRDGFTDVAVGAPREDVGPAADAGTVEIVYGSAGGLAPTGDHWNQDQPDIADATETDDRLGAALAAGDLDGDGDDDLILGAPGESVATTAGAGAVNVIYGSAAGLTSTGNQLWHQDVAGIEETAQAGDSFGGALATGDLNGDGLDDLAVGAPSELVGTTAGAGSVHVINGSASGLTATGDQLWHQNSAGIGESVEAGDAFGAALASGDLNGDARDDLAIGAPSESVGSTADAGSVNVINGSATGLTSTGSQLWSQNSSSILEAAEVGDAFGTALASGDLNGDARDDLAIGVPAESVGSTAGAGSVNVLYGSAGGLGSADDQLWSQNSGGIADAAEAGDSFGAALGAGAFDGAGDDLAIGAPGESVGTIAGAGAINVLYGSGSGLGTAGNLLWSQDSAGILDTAEAGDQFGATLGAGAR